MELKEWLQQEMEAKQLNPSTLAKLAKVPQPTIFRILSGETKDPRTGTVKRLERALGKSAIVMDDIVREFAYVYAHVTERGQEMLRNAIATARDVYIERRGKDIAVVKDRRAG